MAILKLLGSKQKSYYCGISIIDYGIARLHLRVFLAIVMSASSIAFGKSTIIDADLVKAIYSYQFSKFTEWPPAVLSKSGTTLNFCILGKNPFGQRALDAIEGKPTKGRHLRIETYQSGLLPSDRAASCHILFISDSEQGRLNTILSSIQNRPMLTISDIEDFSQRGGMITLITEGQQIRFEINEAALKHADLTISSRLLELAKVIYKQRIIDTR